ncbi:hypothetical protein, partial [Bradyrhizobium sp. SZCCHNR2032]|uniref:hypothetical protein n=1 Tax=Bradyrhizobium sp. SZCCHNR2032 TaxID=3057384 RepID=UPI0029162DB9
SIPRVGSSNLSERASNKLEKPQHIKGIAEMHAAAACSMSRNKWGPKRSIRDRCGQIIPEKIPDSAAALQALACGHTAIP